MTNEDQTKKETWTATLLPPDCVERLQEAAREPDTFTRRCEINAAIEWCVMHYPSKFRKDYFL